MLRRLFKRRVEPAMAPVPEDNALWSEVAECIETASLIVREDAELKYDRVLVVVPGRRFWAENAAEHLAARYPDLTPEQLQRACNWLASKVRAHTRAMDKQIAPAKRPWISRHIPEGYDPL